MEKPIRLTLLPGIDTHLVLKVAPNAICELRSENEPDREKHLKLFSDPEGYIHFYARPSIEHSETAKIVIECEIDGKITTYPYEFRSSLRPTNDMPLPPDSKTYPTPKADSIRPALTEDEMHDLGNADLLKRGYPHRPDPKKTLGAFHTWKRSVSTPVSVMKPSLIAHPDLRADTFATSPNWSGIELRGNAGSFSLVSANWRVPSVFGNPSHFITNSAFWVGIDGDGLNDLVQAGTEQDAIDFNFTFFKISFSSYSAWTEILPQQQTEHVVNSIPVHPDDEMYVQVWIGDAGEEANITGSSAFFFIQNMTRGKLTLVSTPVGATLIVGEEAEWIMERPTVSKKYADLAEYFFARMDNPIAGNAANGFELYSDNADPILITMANNNDVLSTPIKLGPDSILFLWSGAV